MTKGYISKVSQLYDKNFSEDWIEKLSWETESEKESFATANISINKFQEKSFVLLAKSILSGEYLVRRLIPIIESLSQPKDYQPLESESVLKREIYKRYRNLDNELSSVLIHYRAFISSIDRKTDNNNHKYIINAFSIDREAPSINPLYQILINYILPLCRIDHSLSYNDKTIRDLILMRVELEKNMKLYSDEISKVFNVVSEKCSFLLKKLIYFKGKSEYILDFQVYTIDNNDIVIEGLRFLNSNFLLLHEEESILENDKVYLWQDACHKRKAKFFQMILLMNKYKNNGNEEQINHLLEDFNRYCRGFNAKGEFDRFAIKTIKNYLYNCRFSFLLRHRKYNYSQLMEEFQYIESIQKTTGIQNFFPHYKTIGKLFEIIRTDIKNNVERDTVSEELAKLEILINDFEEKLSWSKDCNFYPFQLPYSECLFRIENVALFIPSSFNKPINYTDIHNGFSQYKMELQALKREILFLDERREIDKLKNDMSTLKKTNIEIITGFTAAITFLFGCVNVFSENKNADIKLLVTNISALGLFLLLFCSVIYLLTTPRDESFKRFFSNPKSVISTLLAAGYLYLLLKILIK